jgi:hypothetical protein
MRLPFAKQGPLAVLLAGAGWFALAAAPASGQTPLAYDSNGRTCPPAACPAAPAPLPMPAPTVAPAPAVTPSEAAPPTSELSLDQRFAGLGGETVARSDVGYIDSAIPQTRIRLRYDAAFDDNRPDRAEFFYAKCGCLATLKPTNPIFDPHAAGPQQQPSTVDYQEAQAYFELARDHRFSGFLEIPVRFVEFNGRVDERPDLHSNEGGLSDINFGFKYAVIADKDRYLTCQLRTFTPTGDAARGLGTDHVSLEPALLAFQQVSDSLQVEAELRDWIPLTDSDFAGNVIRYGVGVGYDVYQSHSLRVCPVVEFVGWTVLSGKELDVGGGINSARGDTILNVKLGVRTYFGDRSDVYVGYGRALTGDVWYKDIFRVEYRLTF